MAKDYGDDGWQRTMARKSARGAIEAELKKTLKKLQHNTTTNPLSGNSMANGLVSSEKHIHSISLNVMLFSA